VRKMNALKPKKKKEKVETKPVMPIFHGFTIEDRIEFESVPDNYFPLHPWQRLKLFPKRSKHDIQKYSKKPLILSHLNSAIAGSAILGYSVFKFARNMRQNYLTIASGIAFSGLFFATSLMIYKQEYPLQGHDLAAATSVLMAGSIALTAARFNNKIWWIPSGLFLVSASVDYFNGFVHRYNKLPPLLDKIEFLQRFV